jgi:spore maturation protein B
MALNTFSNGLRLVCVPKTDKKIACIVLHIAGGTQSEKNYQSGISDYLSALLNPVLNIFGVPSELIPMILIKPFSGCGSLAVLENIFITYGADSYLARAGAAIAGSSEAIFYVSAVYFAKTKVSKFGMAIPIALIANLVGAIVACNICKII